MTNATFWTAPREGASVRDLQAKIITGTDERQDVNAAVGNIRNMLLTFGLDHRTNLGLLGDHYYLTNYDLRRIEVCE